MSAENDIFGRQMRADAGGDCLLSNVGMAGAVDQAVELARAERDAGRLGEVSARLATLKSQIAGGGA